VNQQQTQEPRPAASQDHGALPFPGNSGPGGPPLPRREDDRAPLTPVTRPRAARMTRKLNKDGITAKVPSPYNGNGTGG
jgi:hypothetical protein